VGDVKDQGRAQDGGARELTAALDRQHSDASLSCLSGVGQHAPHLVAALEASFSGLDFRASDDAVVLMPTATQLPDWTMESIKFVRVS